VVAGGDGSFEVSVGPRDATINAVFKEETKEADEKGGLEPTQTAKGFGGIVEPVFR
jgi:hypothetical protein